MLLVREAIAPGAPLVGAGCGRFIAQALAARHRASSYDFAELIDCAPDAREMAAMCAPAVAVGLLAERELVASGLRAKRGGCRHVTRPPLRPNYPRAVIM